MSRKIGKFRTIIQESLRVQEGSAEDVKYVDFGTVVSDVSVKQNHVIFARRGCGKTLLLRYTARNLPTDIRAIYLNCEDFKRHSFPNVLIEILDSLFRELDRNLKNWFGLNTKIKKSLNEIRAKLSELKTAEDTYYAEVKSSRKSELKTDAKIAANAKSLGVGGSASLDHISKIKDETEESFKVRKEKLRELDLWLPELKDRVRDFFRNTNRIKNIFIQIDDLYQLRRDDQPFVVDYVYRLCKDVPLFFKIATLKHTSTLYVERLGQPIGAQERHDFQPVNIDYTFADFRRTRDQNKEIFRGFGKQAGLKPEEVDALFMGKGFDRLVWAGGGVPRDTLSLFLEIHQEIRGESIGKDQVRLLSKSNLERRIEELKQDSHIAEQENLIKAIYVIRNFCLEKHTNIFLVSERIIQQDDSFRNLIYRLLDYRIIHNSATALTHKSHQGSTFQAFAIDMGCYAHLRKKAGKMEEIDLSDPGSKERLRSGAVLDLELFNNQISSAPEDVENELFNDEL